MKAKEAEEAELEALAEAFFALSNPRRLRLLRLLTEPRYREEIADALDMSRQSATKHVKKLDEHGFLETLRGWRQTGPVEEFRVDPKRLFALGMTLVDLGKLEPEGGPDDVDIDPTQVLPRDDLPDPDAPPPGETSANLLILDGPRAGERFIIEGEGPRWTVGRADDRDLCLAHDPYISARQCEVQLDPGGHAIVDTHSSNGTMLNFAKIPEGGRASLSPGDVIRIGRTNLVYQKGSRRLDHVA